MRRAILRNRLNGVEVEVYATTEHACSSYGRPVWVDHHGEAYCEADPVIPNPFYEINEY